MANDTATTSTLSDEVKTIYERKMLTRALPRLVHTRWAEKPTLTNYGSLEWRKFPSLAAQSSTLVEAQTPAPLDVTVSKVTTTPLWYGAFVRHSDRLALTAFDPIVMNFSDLLGENAGLSLDTIARDTYIPSATTRWSGSASSLGTVTAIITYKDVVNALGALMANNTMPLESGKFIVIIHPYTWASMLTDSVFMQVFQYAQVRGDTNPLLSGYIGTFLMCDWYITSNAKVYAGQGLGNVDVYAMVMLGKESLGVSSITGGTFNEVDMGAQSATNMTGQKVNPVNIIVKPLGSSGAEDPLDQRGTIAWKAALDAKVLNANWLINLEHKTNF